MSVIKKVKTSKFKATIECFNSANEVVEVSSKREITDSCFHDMHDPSQISSNMGVASFEEAENLMKTGYQPAVDRLKKGIKANLAGQGKRVSFKNDVVGFQPIIPLALQGVPTCMVNTYMKPIKSKVLNIYYNIAVSWATSSKDIINAGVKLLSAILELEMQGYKFNIYAIQSYYDDYDKQAYMLSTKVKSANTPLDLKRISFPLTHTAYFRVIGWDWYSRCPEAKYISGYGRPFASFYNNEEMTKIMTEIFHEKCVYFSATEIIEQDTEAIKEAIKNGSK